MSEQETIQEESLAMPQVQQQPAKASETSSSINAEIEELRKEIERQSAEGELANIPKITFPLASAHIRIAKGQTVWKENLTPPEVLLLCATFHAAVGGLPIEELKLNAEKKLELLQQAEKVLAPDQKANLLSRAENCFTTAELDPRSYKAMLMSRYRNDVVEKLFPGAIPEKLPTSFKEAIRAGCGVVLPKGAFQQKSEGRLFDIPLTT